MSQKNIPTDLIHVFLNEAKDVIENLECALEKLKAERDSDDLLNEMFRGIHTLKGNSAMFGYENVECVLHHFENLFDKARHHELNISDEVIDLTFSVIDFVKDILYNENLKEEQIIACKERLLGEIEQILSSKDQLNLSVKVKSKAVKHTFYLYFKPISEIFNFGANPLYSIQDLYAIGDVKIYSLLNHVPAFGELVVEQCYLGWHILLFTEKTQQDIKDEFLFIQDECQLELVELSTDNLLIADSFVNSFQNKIAQFDYFDSVSVKALVGEYFQKSTISSQTQNDSGSIGKSLVSSIRVEGEKIDQLMNRVSELITIQATLNLISNRENISGLKEVTEQINKTIKQLREITFNISLVPLSQSFSRYNRLVREVSAKLGKQVEFHIEGGDTALEKSMIAQIIDPIMHIIRNGIDHGIETPEERTKLGKNPKGQIVINAYSEGNNIVIEISDDGKGIDLEKIKEAAIDKGIINANYKPSNKDIIDVLFVPGFTTAKKISEVSGRGVGMDVVKRKIGEVRGSVEIETTQGQGTKTIISLPATTSIVDTMHVKVQNKSYLVPISDVAYCEEVSDDNLVLKTAGGCFKSNGEALILLSLRELFNLSDSEGERSKVLILAQGDKKIALKVDAILGTHQAVLKPLNEVMNFNQLFSAVSVLGNGSLALVLDTHKLIKEALVVPSV